MERFTSGQYPGPHERAIARRADSELSWVTTIVAAKEGEMEFARRVFAVLLLAGSGGLCIAQGVFTTTGPTTIPRTSHTATLLPDGRVLIAGGLTSEGPGSRG